MKRDHMHQFFRWHNTSNELIPIILLHTINNPLKSCLSNDVFFSRQINVSYLKHISDLSDLKQNKLSNMGAHKIPDRFYKNYRKSIFKIPKVKKEEEPGRQKH